ncbi:hypothetical protein KC343_g5817 [Hortaea werneckii]|uniref:Uncharacterized protein n=1 Tax=Hortaea werneckii TaxID=91943 RepID=A0A3M7GJV2_HORWE|nr:hypothetical protein KC352_g15503 [Hortaea werneckii]KAI7565944.1 hypothetical protein KC317_g6009 [Hortaea werneckii]KAI7617172.1 hypothetical protein KC346_g5629 [Hortaea werneckii]KAI7628023.1 hypothetical protein KC343_g5817 [Hortaea werneckii]KAI7671071.1 hypothetical protein KC319_g5677 [Hortaea werneckii]
MSLHAAILRVQEAAQVPNDANDPSKHAKVLEAIHNLQLAAEKPEESVMRLRWQFLASSCIRWAIEYGILQTVAEKSGSPVTAEELAKKTGADELLIVTIMRLVTYNGVCEEIGHGIYVANEKTLFLAKPAILGGFTHIFDFGFKTVQAVPDLIKGNRVHQFPEGPNQNSPIQHAFGETMFGVLAKDPRRKKVFDDYLSAGRYSQEPKWFEIFPVREHLAATPKRGDTDVLLVDVGGGKGHDIASFRENFPDLPGKLILQDLPQTFASLQERPNGIELMEHDFFKEQRVKGARLYFLRSIMHDWADNKCIQILKQLAAALDCEHSRIIIDDFVVADMNVDWLTASFDLCMWLFFSGIERTYAQWQKLFSEAQLEIVKVWSTPMSRTSVIEVRKRHANVDEC